jgi:hypothetical protein
VCYFDRPPVRLPVRLFARRLVEFKHDHHRESPSCGFDCSALAPPIECGVLGGIYGSGGPLT